MVVRIGDTMTLVATVAAPGPRRARLLPAHRRLPREGLRRGQVPRRLHQARRAADHQGDPHLAADRPADPAALPRVVSRRGPDPGRADLGRPPERRRVPSMIGASAALMLARVPFLGPIGAIRLGRVDGQFVAFPTAEELEDSDLDLVVASTEQGHRHDRRVRRGAARARDGRRDHGGPPAQPGGHRAAERAARGGGPAPYEHPADPRRPAPPDDLRALRRAAAPGQADRHEGRAQRRDPLTAGHDRQGAGPGGFAPRRPAAPAAPRSAMAIRPRARCRPTPGDRGAGQGGVRRGRGAGRPRADPGRQAARRPRAQGPAADQVRGRPACPAPTARRSSSAARPRPW